MAGEDEQVDLTRWAAQLAATEGPLVRTHEDYLRRATTFLKPIELHAMVEQLRAAIPRDEFFRSPKYQHIKEGWHAAIFGMGYFTFINESVYVRLCGTDAFPDFKLHHAGRTYDFEVTWVVEGQPSNRHAGDRRPGTPYIAPPEQMPTFDVEGLRSVVARKAAKHYATKVNLLAFLGPGGRLVLDSIKAAVEAGGGKAFSSVWVMGLEWMACVYTAGEMPAPKGWHRTGITPAKDPDRIEPAQPVASRRNPQWRV